MDMLRQRWAQLREMAVQELGRSFPSPEPIAANLSTEGSKHSPAGW